MDYFLILSLLIIMTLGFVLVRRVNTYVNDNRTGENALRQQDAGFLVFGSSADAARIRAAGFRCAEATLLQYPNNVHYSALFALSDNDAANLEMCRVAKADDPDISIIARCNDPEQCTHYLNSGADYLLQPGESIGCILAEIKEAGHIREAGRNHA